MRTIWSLGVSCSRNRELAVLFHTFEWCSVGLRHPSNYGFVLATRRTCRKPNNKTTHHLPNFTSWYPKPSTIGLMIKLSAWFPLTAEMLDHLGIPWILRIPNHSSWLHRYSQWATEFIQISWYTYEWIGLRENLQESPIFNGKIYGFL